MIIALRGQAGVAEKTSNGVALSLSSLAFWKRKTDPSEESEANQSANGRGGQVSRLIDQKNVLAARDELKLLEVERQILGLALTTIFESQTKGLLSQKERDYLLGKYKTELKRLEEKITDKQRIVDLFELEESREKLAEAFRQKLAEIDAKIKRLQPESVMSPTTNPIVTIPASNPLLEIEDPSVNIKPEPVNAEPRRETPEAEPKEEPKTKAEKRLEAIREEVLKAMERLEQIEAEG